MATWGMSSRISRSNMSSFAIAHGVLRYPSTAGVGNGSFTLSSCCNPAARLQRFAVRRRRQLDRHDWSCPLSRLDGALRKCSPVRQSALVGGCGQLVIAVAPRVCDEVPSSTIVRRAFGLLRAEQKGGARRSVAEVTYERRGVDGWSRETARVKRPFQIHAKRRVAIFYWK